MIPNFLNPKETIEKLTFLKKDMVALDIGSGSGGWVLPLSEKLENGKVYALDIKEEALSALRSKLDSSRIYNVELLLADAEKGVKIGDNKIDFIILSNILFEINDKKKVLEEVERLLKEGGHVLIIDWKKFDNMGPKEKVVSKEEVFEITKELGLNLEKDLDLGNYHFALIFKK
ncbi:MAG: class I SAM-dependent methyltransferase [Candidatus Pacebacteria bacterium]|nr:class I SAM-dependent methyltransferase [Candidatus Paceibacterota bacterium]